MTTVENRQATSVMNDLSFLWLEITGKCNLTCSHCYADSGQRSNCTQHGLRRLDGRSR